MKYIYILFLIFSVPINSQTLTFGDNIEDEKIIKISEIKELYNSSEKFNTSFDNNGDEASKGKINLELLDQLLSGSNQMQYPRADDKKDYYKIFNNSFLEINKNSLLRTLSEFTAEKIKDFYDFCDEPDEVIFHGGGTKNLFLIKL